MPCLLSRLCCHQCTFTVWQSILLNHPVKADQIILLCVEVQCFKFIFGWCHMMLPAVCLEEVVGAWEELHQFHLELLVARCVQFTGCEFLGRNAYVHD